MKNVFIAIMMLVGVNAMADVYVPYDQWTYLPHCGGEVKLDCPDRRYAKENNQCTIRFSNSYGCNRIKLYTGSDYYPNWSTVDLSMKGTFYVDYMKINVWGRDSFKAYMYSTSSDQYEQVHFQFNY